MFNMLESENTGALRTHTAFEPFHVQIPTVYYMNILIIISADAYNLPKPALMTYSGVTGSYNRTECTDIAFADAYGVKRTAHLVCVSRSVLRGQEGSIVAVFRKSTNRKANGNDQESGAGSGAASPVSTSSTSSTSLHLGLPWL